MTTRHHTQAAEQPTSEQMAAQRSADKVSDLLLALEGATTSNFALIPMAVRVMGHGPAQGFVMVRLAGQRMGLTAAEAELAALCLRYEAPFPGATVLARLIAAAVIQSRQLQAAVGEHLGHTGFAQPEGL